jgi:uncharacterized protein YcfJ
MASAQGHNDPYGPGYDRGGPGGYDRGYEGGSEEGAIYDYAKVVDVQPLTTRVRVSHPQRECWDETRYEEQRGYSAMSDSRVAGGTLLGAVIGAAIGNQIGSGSGRKAATAGGAVVGAAIGNQQAKRRSGYVPPPPREYTVQRCETRYQDEWHERVEAYRVTYLYQGRRQVTELPYRPGDRIRVRVDVTPAES